MTGSLAGTPRLVRLALRRDRIKLTVWIGALTLLIITSAQAVIALYPTEAERVEFARTSAASAASLALNGLVSGTSTGAIVASQLLLLGAVGTALMSTLLVVRHTRQEEETGRAELVGSAVVGRHAILTAALVVGLGANLTLALLSTVGLVALGLPVGGSLAMCLAMAMTGTAFLGIGAVAAQIPESARAANGIAAAALGVAFLLRAAGDVSGQLVDGGTRVIPGKLTWLSPIGWAELVRPYDKDAWWLLGLLVLLGVTAMVLAYALQLRRDLGAGLRPARPGPATASRWLSSPFGLAWRLQRGTLAGWAIGVAAVGLAYGSIGPEVEEMLQVGDVADLVDQLGGGGADLTEAFFAAIFGFMAVAASAYAVQAILRMRAEESSGRLDQVLAAAVGRTTWVWSHAVIAFAGAVFLLGLSGATTGLAYGLSVGGAGEQTARLAAAALVYAPATLVIGGVAILAFAAVPRLAIGIAWGVLTAFLLVGQVGQLLDLPQAVLDVSPFNHVPAAPVAPVTAGPLVALAVVAALLTGLGLVRFRQRDLAS